MTQPAGWYEDPNDSQQLRYWDGVIWTANTTPRVSPTAQDSTIGRAFDVPDPAQHGQRGAHAQPTKPAPPSQHGQPPQYGQPGLPPGVPPQGFQPTGQASPWTRPGPAAPDGTPLASWWQRLFARLLDGLFVGIVIAIAASPWLTKIVSAFNTYFRAAMDAARTGANPPSSAAFQTEIAQYILPVALLSMVLTLVYETAFLTWRGATPGKMLLGTRVRRVDRSGPLRLSEALRRQAITVGASAFAVVPFVGSLGSLVQLLDDAWLLWDPRRQCLHDKVADTVVVRSR